MEDNVIKQEPTNEGVNIRDIFLLLKRRIALILAIVLAFTVGGVAYSFLIKPKYTVTQKISYQCENLPYIDKNGVTVNPGIADDFNTMVAYGDTIVDLFDEGVVIDRANYYYNEYLNKKNVSEQEAKNYLEELKNKAFVSQKDTSYSTDAVAGLPKHVSNGNISTTNPSKSTETNFTFTASYTADTVQEARDKLLITVYAFSLECMETKDVNGTPAIKYFGEFKVIVSDLGETGVASSVSKVRTIILFFIIGVVVALAVVFVMNLLDNTIKDKKELEKIVGAPTLAAVQKWED